jgi:hypothetical protein
MANHMKAERDLSLGSAKIKERIAHKRIAPAVAALIKFEI